MSYKLLSEPIRKYVRNKRWEKLRPIQAVSIQKIISTDKNYILASRTASGKTEAVFLPILSKVDFNSNGVQVLYISPLIALINDQFGRIEDMCKDLDISVTKWHGEAKKSLKLKLINNPNGIVLITPESIEAMFVNSPYNVALLFGNLKYIVIDEIHSFLGIDRGLQLMSLLSRIQQLNKRKIIKIGLSATIGDDNYIQAKRLLGDINDTNILLDRSKKKTNAFFKFFDNKTRELSLELLKDLYKETANNKVLIFPNNRGRTEEIAVKLRKISDIVGGHKYYYSHHSSVDKEIREDVEYFAKNNQRYNFCISCTSTLELGIDIGTVDKIIQIDSTHSVASLVQRIGRSGRKEGEISVVNIYATNNWSLLQSLACWNLYKNEFIEPILTSEKPYDILLHQVLSIVKQLSGCSNLNLFNRIRNNTVFCNIKDTEITNLILDFIKLDYLEKVDRELILGLKGEEIVNSRDFYSVFQSENNYKVVYKGRKIGEIPLSPIVIEGENILLAAKIWKIDEVDTVGSKIFVKPAYDGKTPLFFGGSGDIHHKVREEMLRILKDNIIYSELNEVSLLTISDMRKDFIGYKIDDYVYDRPIIQNGKVLKLFTFSGSKINRSLNLLISLTKFNSVLNDSDSSIELGIKKSDFKILVNEVNMEYKNIDEKLENIIQNNSELINFTKWGKYLPIHYQIEVIKDRLYDFDNAIKFINNIRIVEVE